MNAEVANGHGGHNFNSRAHHSRLRVLVMVLVGAATAVAVGSLMSWAYAPALGWAGRRRP